VGSYIVLFATYYYRLTSYKCLDLFIGTWSWNVAICKLTATDSLRTKGLKSTRIMVI